MPIPFHVCAAKSINSLNQQSDFNQISRVSPLSLTWIFNSSGNIKTGFFGSSCIQQQAARQVVGSTAHAQSVQNNSTSYMNYQKTHS